MDTQHSIGRPLSVALVGYGRVGEIAHAPAWANVPGARLVAIVDTEPARRLLAGRRWNDARIYSRIEECLVNEQPDILDIATPPAFHLAAIRSAALGGVKSVICEKPLVPTMSHLLEVERLRRLHTLKIFTVDNWRHSKPMLTALETVDSGSLGSLRRIDLQLERPHSATGCQEWMPGWRLDPDYSGGGILMDHGWHQLGLAIALVDARPVIRNVALGGISHSSRSVETRAEVVLDSAGIRTDLTLSWIGQQRLFKARIVGDRACMLVTASHVVVGDDLVIWRSELGLDRTLYDPDDFARVFAIAIRARQDNFDDARRIMALIVQAYGMARAWWLSEEEFRA